MNNRLERDIRRIVGDSDSRIEFYLGRDVCTASLSLGNYKGTKSELMEGIYGNKRRKIPSHGFWQWDCNDNNLR